MGGGISGKTVLLILLCGFAAQAFPQGFEEGEATRHMAIDDKLPAYHPNGQAAGTFSLVGSGIMSGILTPAAERFTTIYENVTINVSYPSSAAVFKGLMEGAIKLGAMSRPLSQPEKLAFAQKFNRPIREVCIAVDALEILVHRFNPINGLTLEELDAIYSSAALRGGSPVVVWGDLGLGGTWQNQSVEAFGGGAGWGTTTTFEAMVTWGAPSKSSVHPTNIENGVPQAVANNIGAIGYTCLGKRPVEVRSLPIAETAGSRFIPCTEETLQNGMYPLRRPLFLYAVPDEDGALPAAISEFLLFLLSKDGQGFVSDAGMVPLPASQVRAERKVILGEAPQTVP